MLLNFGFQGVDHLLGRLQVCVAQELQQAVVAELLLLLVLGLVQSVGVDEERVALDVSNLLPLVL